MSRVEKQTNNNICQVITLFGIIMEMHLNETSLCLYFEDNLCIFLINFEIYCCQEKKCVLVQIKINAYDCLNIFR